MVKSINPKSSLIGDAPILKSILKKPVRNVPANVSSLISDPNKVTSASGPAVVSESNAGEYSLFPASLVVNPSRHIDVDFPPLNLSSLGVAVGSQLHTAPRSTNALNEPILQVFDANLPEGDGISVATNAGKSRLSTTNISMDHVVPNIQEYIKSKHDVIEGLFGVSLKSANDLDLFLKGIEEGKYPIWPNMDNETRSQVYEAMSGLMEFYVPNTKVNASNSDVNGNNITTNVNVEVVSTSPSSSLVAEAVCEGVNVSIPRRIVEKVSARLEHTLYGYFIGNRMAFPVVDYFVKNNWAKCGLKKIMMNVNGFFFFKFDTQAGLESVLEDGPWMIRKSPLILKKWSIGTRLCKEELTRIPIWVKLHDVPLQVFEDDGINLIASFIGKPIMLDSYTSSMCKDSWGRSSFARCLIEVGSVDELVDVITIGVPSLIGDGFTKESIRVEYGMEAS